MDPLLKKLNHKDHGPIFVLGAPPDLAPAFEPWRATAPVDLGPVDAPVPAETRFLLGFATTLDQVATIAATAAALAPGDVVVWCAYPKSSSKRYKCAFNRDTGWAALGAAEFEPVRQVALDEDWSALRFRRVSFIQTMTRSFAMTEAGQEKAARARS